MAPARDDSGGETESEVRDWWEATAEYFQAEAELSPGVHWGPGVPEADRDILPAIADRDVIELGCGAGQLGLGLLELGATRVVGVDLSRAQLTHAAEFEADRDDDLPLIEGSVSVLPVADDIADLAVSAYAFQWVPDLEATFEETARCLRPAGQFVFSLPHPFYQVFDPDTETLSRSYHDPVQIREQESGIAAEQILQQRRLSDIFSALRDAGFVVDRLWEPGVSDSATYTDRWNSSAVLMSKVPRTLIVRAVLDNEI